MKFWNIKNKKFTSILIIICIFTFTFAQFNTYSPFSRFGIGDIQENTLAHQKAMNNSGLAIPLDTTAPMFINLLNPASLASMRFSVLEASVNYYNTKILNQQNFKVKYNSVNFNSLVIGFPIKKFSGFCFGLLPYSFVGYKINQTEYVNNIGNINYVYEGSGGLNKVFAAYGFSLSKYFKTLDKSSSLVKEILSHTSIGINVHYIFGELGQVATVNYPSKTTYYNFVNDHRYRINGTSFEMGIQTFINLNSDKTQSFHFGFSFSNPSPLKVINDYLAYNFSYNYFGEKYIVDTVLYSENEIGKLKLPTSIGTGISYIITNKAGLNIDAHYTNWKNFLLNKIATNVTDNFEINIGGFYQPDRFATGKSKYFDRVIYRMGIGYNSGYQEYKKKPIPLFSISTGVSLPMGLYRAFSAMHISAQYFIKGNKNFPLRENIFKLYIGFTLNDRWFIKYKYD